MIVIRKRNRAGKPCDVRLFDATEDRRIEELRTAGLSLRKIAGELSRGHSSIQMRLETLARRDDGQ